jgi:HD-GYP domain-containing protein (c-di-GMP phosphodiesterase class II)
LSRVGIGARLLATGMRPVIASLRSHCMVTSQLAAGLGLPDEVPRALAHTFARWDGKGVPSGVRGNTIAVPARLLALADVVEAYHRLHGVEAATAEIRGQAGTVLDPDAVEALAQTGPGRLGELSESEVSVWQAVLDAAPVAGTRPLTAEAVDAAFGLLADYADLKSRWFIGHSRAVADLVGAAAAQAGLADAEVTMLRRAALLRELGRTGVPNTIWDKRGSLSAAEQERMRLHAYYTDRILRSVPGLAGYADLASSSHERLDGSGYPRRISGNDIPRSHRLLAAADAYQTTLEQRPHRTALTEPEAAHRLRGEVTAGRLDSAAVEAVLAAAGHRAPRGSAVAPAGLTPRELEVLTLVCRGANTREVARNLAIAHKTVSNHIERAYLKIGVTSRAAATLYASRHGLV